MYIYIYLYIYIYIYIYIFIYILQITNREPKQLFNINALFICSSECSISITKYRQFVAFTKFCSFFNLTYFFFFSKPLFTQKEKVNLK